MNLELDQYQRWAGRLTDGFKAAAKVLHQQYMFDTKFLPYGSQLVPLAAILTLVDPRKLSTYDAQTKLSRWLWCGVFGELYGGTTETRFGRDLPEVVAWIDGSTEEPRTVQDAQFATGRLDTLRTRGSAAYKGIYALLLKNRASDWRSGEEASVTTYFDEAVDIHHIFPRAWCDKNGILPATYNSIINKTPLTARTNRIISGDAPSHYVPRLAADAQVDISVVHSHIASHVVDPELLFTDNFEAFMMARRSALLRLIGGAMGKQLEVSTTVDLAREGLDGDGSDVYVDEDLQDA